MDLAVRVDVDSVHFSPKVRDNRIVVKNDENGTIAFKMKMTVLDGFSVKPHGGFVKAGESVKIAISIDPSRLTTIDSGRLVIETRRLSDTYDTALQQYDQGDDAAMRTTVGMPADVEIKTSKHLALWMLKHGNLDTAAKVFDLTCTLDPALLAGAPNASLSARSAERRASERLPDEPVMQAPPRTASTPVAPTMSVSLTAPPSATSDAALSSEIDSATRELNRLRVDINALEQRRQEMYSTNKVHQAAAEELRSKSEKAGTTLSIGTVLLLWLLCFYVGLSLDRYYFVTE